MILGFEGLPAVGKSTVARELASHGDTYVIPEVNRLFRAPKPCTEEWYFDREVARWEMAAYHASTFKTVIFDGDPFQPLWFNWIFAHEKRWASVDEVAAFFRSQIERGRIAFPDVYVYFHIDNDELRRRRHERDRVEGPATIDAKFRKYLLMEKPLGRYFQILAETFPVVSSPWRHKALPRVSRASETSSRQPRTRMTPPCFRCSIRFSKGRAHRIVPDIGCVTVRCRGRVSRSP